MTLRSISLISSWPVFTRVRGKPVMNEFLNFSRIEINRPLSLPITSVSTSLRSISFSTVLSQTLTTFVLQISRLVRVICTSKPRLKISRPILISYFKYLSGRTWKVISNVKPLIHTVDKIWDVLLTHVFPIPGITTTSVVLLPENFEAADSLINEHSAPESKQNGNDSPRWVNFPVEASTTQESTRRSLLWPLFFSSRNGQLGAIWPSARHLKQNTLDDVAGRLHFRRLVSFCFSVRIFLRQTADSWRQVFVRRVREIAVVVNWSVFGSVLHGKDYLPIFVN